MPSSGTTVTPEYQALLAAVEVLDLQPGVKYLFVLDGDLVSPSVMMHLGDVVGAMDLSAAIVMLPKSALQIFEFK